ncbi:MAG: hypothetical protein AMJ78_01115 [Omnitrophica WOR_2 bacterium SM23_29]|nr:MAG: hypothetical protein AMJ78_01115 [Omnitrophica WOR_2 bacterium SM23_29]
MSQKEMTIEADSNFHHIAGEDILSKEDAEFQEYRRKWKEHPENFYVGAFPLFIDIEVTSKCNLKCPFCATTFRNKTVRKGLLRFKILKKIIDEGMNNGLYGVKFNIRGEPLLHPQIHKFVKYAKDRGLLDVYFNTNALLLTEEMSRRLIDAGLDRISISIEGYTKQVYERYRVGAKFETVLTNIRNLQSLKKRFGVKHPKVRIQTVMLSDIEPIFDKYRRFWAKLADEVGYLDYKEMKVKKKGIRYPWACPQIWQRMAVWWDGTILPCNHDDDGLLVLGNINETTIKKSWHSKKLNTVREIHKWGNAHEIPACDGCYLRNSEILKLIKKGANYGSCYLDG